MGLSRASLVYGALAGLGVGAVGYGLYLLTKKLYNRKVICTKSFPRFF